MSEATLPEELVNEILKHAIQAHPDTFLGPSRDRASFHRPNAPPSPLGSSHLLLVSKRWLRIGTPLLYTSLWISADAHTQTLLHIFRGNPALGALVLDLRLDGGFGSELHDVVLSMPNVRNVYLSWGLGQGHSMVGLWDTMSVLRPIKLWLGPHGDVMKEGLEAAGLTSLLAACISGRWNSLVRASRLAPGSAKPTGPPFLPGICPSRTLVPSLPNHCRGFAARPGSEGAQCSCRRYLQLVVARRPAEFPRQRGSADGVLSKSR
ncbi:uncharacterized protein PHACADRAFT_250828 [Phanerochaete carnosa HHB-10118-sp]|uniref:Uncharacterized protein n=1 Tax=Phanerochaete carnosa (strain HHB-10118-sp) TaxID=650164 RepID=K5XAN3_PHACS|nr:uncharacterized protein PHACADRAFT_250828 [Phanerochaete carnosa HHB-10118-sp]EKM59992.1 hypothetical protein PHACADRAFT_250828 [Phanerochaete carnosa HHB-10118-sp]